MRDNFPANRFLQALIEATVERLEAMNVEQVAQHYGLPADWVRYSRDRELETRR